MFCPICKSEYREGFEICAECKVKLVDQLPPEPEAEIEFEFVDFEEVLSTFNPADIALIKSLLDGEGIIYFIQGEHFSYMQPLALPARLMVKRDQAEEAREILKDLKLSYAGTNLPKNLEENEED